MLYFIRHGECVANVERKFAGQRLDSPLTALGEEQALASAQEILASGIEFDRIISSPLQRTLNTARLVAEKIGFENEIVNDNRIAEYDMGVLSGMPHEKIDSLGMISSDQAEPVTSFMARVESFLDEAARCDKLVLMVSHAGVGRMIDVIKNDLDPRIFYDLECYPNGSVTKIL